MTVSQTSNQTSNVTRSGRELAAARQKRYRKKVLRELFAGTGVRLCGGPDACIWRGDLVNGRCGCTEGAPCRCERRYLEEIIEDATPRVGAAVGGILAGAIMDVARGVRMQEEDKVRDARLKLLDILLRDQRGRQDLDQRERRLVLQERRKRTNAEIIDAAVRSAAEVKDGDDSG